MPLFRDNPVRSTAAAAIGLLVAYATSSYLSSPNAMQLIQATVALLAVGALVWLVTMHHNQEGHLMTQAQEEMVLIGSFALFWMATMLAWRALSQNSGLGTSGEMGLSTTTQPAGSGDGGRSVKRPNYCGKDDVYCIIEEFYY